MKVFYKAPYRLEKGTEGSAGYDLKNAGSTIKILPGEAAIIDTGLTLEMEPGYYGKLTGRSGLNFKRDITVDQDSVIDSDYRGVVKVKLRNKGKLTVVIGMDDTIAQMVFQKYETPEFKRLSQDSELSETKRGKGGFGHTGL